MGAHGVVVLQQGDGRHHGLQGLPRVESLLAVERVPVEEKLDGDSIPAVHMHCKLHNPLTPLAPLSSTQNSKLVHEKLSSHCQAI